VADIIQLQPKRPVYEIDIINKNIGAGSSQPVLIRASNMKDYVLKTKYDNYGNFKTVFCELLSYEIACELGYADIMPGRPILLNIDDITLDLAENVFKAGNISEISYKNIMRSRGVNIGIPFVSESQITNVVKKADFIQKTLFVDSYMINMDRNPTNPNIIYSSDYKRYYAIDFGYSFYYHCLFAHIDAGKVSELIGDDPVFCKHPGEDATVIYLEKYRHYNFLKESLHCLLKTSGKLSMPRGHKAIDAERIKQIIGTFPDDWQTFSELVSGDVSDILGYRIGNRKVIM
jgi:hypothetical protein